jgi:glycine hydroxymethyltransferase
MIVMEDVVFELITLEKQRQMEGLELIPSENYVSQAVLAAMGSVLTNKYSEGYPNFEEIFATESEIITQNLPNYRYYGGQENVDKIERLAIARACRLFRADHANVQPHSGANANEAVYFAWCEPGDKILAMSLAAGGHLTHGAKVTRSAREYQFVHYGVNSEGEIDYNELEKLALKERPKLILVGYSAYMKIPDFKRVAKIAEKVSALVESETGRKFEVLLMADMAHVAGLIAGGAHPNPLDFGFQVMTCTTHKTLRGPRGGLILSKGKVSSPLKGVDKNLTNLPTLIDRAVFPGTQGGPLEHVIAAKAVAFGEALKPEFKKYIAKLLENAKILAAAMIRHGFVLQGGGTENHLILADVRKSFGFDGKFYEIALDKIGLTLNANAVANDKDGIFRPSGVRLGTPAVTTRGMGESEMQIVADWMLAVAEICKKAKSEEGLSGFREELQNLRQEVKQLALSFPI